MRILVTGASGLLGGRLAQLLSARHEVVCGRHRIPGPAGLPEIAFDLEDDRSIAAALECRPDAVVSSAALVDPDVCEREHARAERMNTHAPAVLAALCRRRGIRLAHLSTDLVFDGTQAPARERVRPRPVLVYGRTKLDGEDAVLAEHPGAAVFRVALVHGHGFGPRGTATEAVARALRTGRAVTLFTDQHRTTIDPESLADALHRALEGGHAGIFHAGGPERLSRFDIGQRVAARFDLPAYLIVAGRSVDDTSHAARPADVALDCHRTRSLLRWEPRPFDAGLAETRLEA